jgi:hypothetical protein
MPLWLWATRCSCSPRILPNCLSSAMQRLATAPQTWAVLSRLCSRCMQQLQGEQLLGCLWALCLGTMVVAGVHLTFHAKPFN